MEIEKNMVFEYTDREYIKYFIPKELVGDGCYGIKLDKEFNIIGADSWSNEYLNNKNHKNIFKLAEKTLDTLYIGDITIDNRDVDCPIYRKVLGRCGNIICSGVSSVDLESATKYNEVSATFTIQELKDDDWEVYKEPKVEEKMISIGGKKFSKDTIKEALKNYINK